MRNPYGSRPLLVALGLGALVEGCSSSDAAVDEFDGPDGSRPATGEQPVARSDGRGDQHGDYDFTAVDINGPSVKYST